MCGGSFLFETGSSLGKAHMASLFSRGRPFSPHLCDMSKGNLSSRAASHILCDCQGCQRHQYRGKVHWTVMTIKCMYLLLSVPWLVLNYACVQGEIPDPSGKMTGRSLKELNREFSSCLMQSWEMNPAKI